VSEGERERASADARSLYAERHSCLGPLQGESERERERAGAWALSPVSIRQHTSAYVSIRQLIAARERARGRWRLSAYVSILHTGGSRSLAS
jgi:hypothetical protein